MTTATESNLFTAQPAQTQSQLKVFDKASAQLIDSLAIDDAGAVALAIEKAKKAQTSWAATPVKERAAIIKKARKEYVAARSEIKEALGRETGKSPFDVIGELFSVCQDVAYLAKKTPRWLKPRKVGTSPLFGKKGWIHYKPYGVVGIISPWNAPLNLAMGDALPALFAGNAVVIKPSEITPLAVKLTVEAFNKVLPEGVLQVLIGEGETGAALVEQVDMITVTGSCQTGKRVMASASNRLTPVLLELGGKDPMIVLADADLERAANAAAWGCCFMTGQVCMSIERIYVEKPVAAQFKQKLLEKMQKIRTGPDLPRNKIDYGPFTGPKQIDIVEAHVEDAKQQGANILCGGERIQKGAGGVYFQPTLIAETNHDMKIMTEETFGPIASVMEVENEEEALRLANDSEFGLNASVWTRDIDRGIALALRINSGNVCINDAIMNAGVPALPFGGAKLSGVGNRHGGAEGVRAFCQVQSMMIEKRSKTKEMTWFPYGAKRAARLEKLMTLLYR